MPAPPPVSDEARAVHAAACVIDLHADTPKLIARGYDIYKRHATPWPLRRYGGHVDLPRMREGGQAAQFFGMWTFPRPERGCNADVHRQLDGLSAAVAGGEGLALCVTGADIRRCRAEGRVAALCGIEGGQALEGGAGGPEEAAVAQLRRFAERKVRYLGLLHFSRNALGAPAMGWGMDGDTGLTAAGCAVIDACRDLGVLVDLAHINRRGFFEAAARRPGPLLVTHTGVAGVQPHWRNVDDEQLRTVADSGGVVGVIFAPRFLGRGGVEGVVAHLLHVVAVAGEDAVALGSDWDGFVQPPEGLRDPSELPNLTEALLRQGLRPEAVHKLLGGNVLRVLDEVGPLRAAA
jgi:membrane dipeptidase